MKRLLLLITATISGLIAIAQSPQTVPTTQSYGKVDKADLELKACDFEKDANAEILFSTRNTTSFLNCTNALKFLTITEKMRLI